MSRGLGSVLVALGVIAAVAAQGLGARAASLADDDDARGALDVRVVTKVFRRRPVWRVTTHDRWRPRRLRDRGYVLVFLDTFGGARFDYYVVVRAAERRLRGLVWLDRRPPRSDRRIAYLPVWRRDRRSLTLRLLLQRLTVGRNRDSYRWYVQTVMTSGGCRRACFDRAPDSGAVTEELEPPSASPSPPED
jgi:hypothetical protein